MSPVDAHVITTKYRNNTVRPLCLLAFSVLCLVFVRVIFLQIQKNQGYFFLTGPSMLAYHFLFPNVLLSLSPAPYLRIFLIALDIAV